jgi:enoyl-CoA hydratase/isomerase-like protein
MNSPFRLKSRADNADPCCLFRLLFARIAEDAMTREAKEPIITPMNAPVSEDLVLVGRMGAVTRLSINRAASRNALSTAMMTALQKAFDAAINDDSRVIVLTAAGSAFCAGHDLKEMTELRDGPDKGRAAFAEIFAQCSRLM